jgi:hypothetical protein
MRNTVTATTIGTDKSLHGDQPRTKQFGTVKVGELYWVRLSAILGPTVRELQEV